MSTLFFEDKERMKLLGDLVEHWCKDYTGFQREQMEQVLLRNLQGYPTERLQAVVDDINR